MSQWCFIVLATFILGAVAVPLREDPVGFKNATWTKCQKQENVPNAVMQELYFFLTVDGIKDNKCVMKCIDEEYGIYQNGAINKEMIVEAIKEHWTDTQEREKLISIAMVCVDSATSAADPCQYTYDIFDCFIQDLKKEGITFDLNKMMG